MLFENSNPSSCPFSGCSITSQSSCTGYYSVAAQGCANIGLTVTSAGVLSIPSIANSFICCEYIMACSVNGMTKTSNPF